TARISLSPQAEPAPPALQRWIAEVSAEIDALLRGEADVGAPGQCASAGLTPLQADAVAQVQMLRGLLRDHLHAQPDKVAAPA
ncbi:MAG: hypothetical protein RSF79_20820, partial [Janthinobacterium sp.]